MSLLLGVRVRRLSRDGVLFLEVERGAGIAPGVMMSEEALAASKAFSSWPERSMSSPSVLVDEDARVHHCSVKAWCGLLS